MRVVIGKSIRDLLFILVGGFYLTPVLAFNRLPYDGPPFYRVEGSPPVLSLKVNLQSTDTHAGTTSDQFQAAQNAATTWFNDGASSFRFTVQQTTSINSVSEDQINAVITYSGTGTDAICDGGSLGHVHWQEIVEKTNPGVDPDSNEYYAILEMDVVLCDTQTLAVDGYANAYDIESILAHEFGHTFGLGHGNTESNPDSCADIEDQGNVMDTCVLDLGEQRHALSSDDIAGIQHIYGIRDDDGDGFNVYNDCNDNNAAIHSGVSDTCDGVDNNCDGQVDPTCDDDGDGLNNSQEGSLGTNPKVADTDGDGLNDGQEVNTYHTDPLKADTDGDTLSDGQEVNTYKTDPLKKDTDGDGLTDDWEIELGTDPLTQTYLMNAGISFLLDPDLNSSSRMKAEFEAELAEELLYSPPISSKLQQQLQAELRRNYDSVSKAVARDADLRQEGIKLLAEWKRVMKSEPSTSIVDLVRCTADWLDAVNTVAHSARVKKWAVFFEKEAENKKLRLSEFVTALERTILRRRYEKK